MLSPLDNFIIILFILFLVGVGFYFSKAVKDMESFYLGNRSLPWSLTVGALVATWYGGVGTVGTVEYGALYGLSCWLVWCVTAHAGRMPLALWVGPSIHVRTDLTVPDLLNAVYGKTVAIVGAVLMLIYCTQFSQITAMGFLGKQAWGFSELTSGVIVLILVCVVAILGGIMSVAVTDMILFWSMCVGITLVFPGQFHALGGWAGITSSLTAMNHKELLDPIGGFSFMKALMLIVLSFGVYADPTFYQRFSAASSPKAGRRALLSCFCLWVTFDVILTITGLMVAIKYPKMTPGDGYITMVLTTLPAGLRAIFVIGLGGSIVSALDGYYLSGATTFANDIYGRIKGDLTQKELVLLTRIGIFVLSIGGLSVAFRFTVANNAFIFISSLWMAAGFVPIVGALIYKGKKTPMGGLLGLIVGATVWSAMKIFYTMHGIDDPPIDPLIGALPSSFIAWVIGNQFGESVEQKIIVEDETYE